MANEKRLIDANEVERRLEIAISSWWSDCNSNAPVIARAMTDALQRVKYAPTVDAVEVVRCRDCKYARKEIALGINEYFMCEYTECYHNGEHFCSYGERKDSDEND